MRAEA